MLSLFPLPARRRLPRRGFLRMGALAAGGLSLPALLHAEERFDREAALGRATARNCIYLFLCGGPSQPDLWDLKPEAPSGVRTQFEPIETNVPGIWTTELLPRLSRHADKLAFIRSLTHGDHDHDGAIVRTLLGEDNPQPADKYIARSDHPGLGAILHALLGSSGGMPAWVILPRYFTTYSPPYKGQSAGFLGGAFDPLVFDKERKGSLTEALLKLDARELPEGLSAARLQARRVLRDQVGSGFAAEGAPAVRGLEDNYEQAFNLLTSPAAERAFDLAREPDPVRDRYGRNEYGQSLLMARRLIESGVRMVNVFWTFFDEKGCQFNLWDNHGVASDVCGIDGQLKGADMLRHDYCCPSFDHSFSALLEDLEQRGLLEDTLVVVAGEFGRTPKINEFSGRDHWPHCYTQLLAGGGVRGGQVYGASDAQGMYVKDRPVTPDDFAATVLHAFGLPPEAAVHDPTGRPVRITPGNPLVELF